MSFIKKIQDEGIVLNVWMDTHDGYSREELVFNKEELISILSILLSEMGERNLNVP